MNEPVWLTPRIVLDIHRAQLERFGGPIGVRDMGLLESALARAQNRRAYGDNDLTSLAAAYAFGIARNHPFVDGNKRTSFASMLVFLGLNGLDFTASNEEAISTFLALAAGEVAEEHLATWITRHCRQ